MPQLGGDSKKKSRRKAVDSRDDKNEVVSAYSEEGIKRNKDLDKPLGKGFKAFIITMIVLLPILALVAIFFLEKNGIM